MRQTPIASCFAARSRYRERKGPASSRGVGPGAQCSIIIHSRRDEVACDDGQEAHLSQLAAYVDKRVGELVAAVGQVGDARLLVMATLLVADELSDAYAEVEALKSAGADATEAKLGGAVGDTRPIMRVSTIRNEGIDAVANWVASQPG